jgi:uncharacterized protein (TIGR03435 family)
VGQDKWEKSICATAGVLTLIVLVTVGMITSPPLRAQALADRPKFDAVSIKVNRSAGVGSVNLTQSGGHLTASNVSLKFLIIQAYELGRVNFASNPTGANWIDSEHFDIEAEAEGNPTVDQKRLMIRALLADRFKLTMRHETRQLPQYALVLSKPGSLGRELKPHTFDTKCVDVPAGQPRPAVVPGAPLVPPCGALRVVGDDLVGQDVTMAKLSETLGILVERNVVDRTGQNGTFDLTLHFQRALEPDAGASDPSGPPSIFTALQEQLGLRLKPQKGPIDVLVIDHVEEPSAN